jgi:hypothetical protein
MQDLRAELVATIRWQVAGCLSLGAPFYSELCEELARDVLADGPTWDLLAPFASEPFEAAYVLRLLGGVHRLVLSGHADAIAAHFPTEGDGNAREAMQAIRSVIADPPREIIDALSRPPQTNEVGRSAALASGVLVIAAHTGLPLRLREIGSSGGLNLRLDHYWYEQGGEGWGDPSSSIRFVDMWERGTPPFLPGALVDDRRGCDRDPVDVTTRDGALKLLSYVWPESTDGWLAFVTRSTSRGGSPHSSTGRTSTTGCRRSSSRSSRTRRWLSFTRSSGSTSTMRPARSSPPRSSTRARTRLETVRSPGCGSNRTRRPTYRPSYA